MTVPTQIALVCHAPLASALHAVACHAFGGHLDELLVVDVPDHATAESVAQTIHQVWSAAGKPQQLLLLVDLMGATPCNGVQHWLRSPSGAAKALAGGALQAQALSGVNLPMLLRALTHRSLAPSALAQELLNQQRPQAVLVPSEAPA